jgi:cytochrome c2
MRRLLVLFLPVPALIGAAACGAQGQGTSGTAAAAPDAGPAADAEAPVITLAEEPQRAGDPAKGYRALVNEAYVPCGIPWSAYSKVFTPVSADQQIPGREGRNETLPHNYTAMTTKDGVEIVTSNCLACHAGRIDGKLVVGLGNADGDFTRSAEDQKNVSANVGLLLTDPKERAEWEKWRTRVDTIAPYTVLSTRGPNPADNFTAVLFAHHDPKTLAWSDTPLMDVPPPHDTPVDVPPWWRMKKKTSMFYVGGGRGDHARIMMTASILCTSSVEESRAIDAYFADIRAYIASIEPPKYPWPIAQARADRGRTVFESACSRCHGTYGAEAKYPNRVVPLPEVGTDPVLASGTAQFGPPFVEWFAKSFFGEISRLEPKEGYVAPPLDGVWATAPYLHNGSVPTIEALLDSSKRPAYWTRAFDSTAYDQAALGWTHKALSRGKSAQSNDAARKSVYDTTLLGYGNGGHLFGDALSPDDRSAVIEYLKTL